MERTRVIIADDESLIRMDLREMLTNLGYLVVGEVADGMQRRQPGARTASRTSSSWISRCRTWTGSRPPRS